jgi:hypothetical protein
MSSAFFLSGFDHQLILVLAIPVLLFLTRAALRPASDSADAGCDDGKPELLSDSVGDPSLDPGNWATFADQQDALGRLCELPQFCRLMDGTVVDWSSGAQILLCDCRESPSPHLMMSWGVSARAELTVVRDL